MGRSGYEATITTPLREEWNFIHCEDTPLPQASKMLRPNMLTTLPAKDCADDFTRTLIIF